MNMNIEINWDIFPQDRDTFKITFVTRAWVPFIIDNEEYSVQIGVEAVKYIGTGDYIVKDVWIEKLEGAPDFKLTEEMKKELADAIIELPDSSGIEINESVLNEKKFSSKERAEMAEKGEALSDGSFPIKSKQDLINAIKSQSRGLRNADDKRKKEVLAHIYKRAKSLGIKLSKTEKGYWSIVKESNDMKTIMNFNSFVNEKWAVDVKVKQTGEHAGKTITEINKEITALKDKHAKAREKDKNYKVSDADKSKMSQLLFAKRAKKHWNK